MKPVDKLLPFRRIRSLQFGLNTLLIGSWRIHFLGFLITTTISCQPEPFEEEVPGNEEEEPEVIVGLPELLTHEISDISIFSITAGGAILDTGFSQVLEQGIVADTIANPTLDQNLNSFSLPVDSSGVFTTEIINTPPGQDFYFRSYAINSEGIGFGNEVTFRSLDENMIQDIVKLSTQEEVIEFGSNGYNKIRGSLNISGTVNDLTPLKDLIVITGGVRIRNSMISNFQGLENLRIIGNDIPNGFMVQKNSQLESFEGLNNLEMINGDFYVEGSSLLEDFSGLETLMGVNWGGFTIMECAGLTSLSGLKNFRFITDNMSLRNNPLLSDLSALANLEEFIGFIRIVGHHALTNLNGLEGITDIESIELVSNDNLINLDGLRNLETVSDVILIRNNNSLETISIFNQISRTEYLTIENNKVLKSIDGLNELQSVAMAIIIESNPELGNINCLGKLSKVRSLSIAYNDNLSDIEGLSNLAIVTHRGAGDLAKLVIALNPNLVSLSGLEGLSQVDGSFYIHSNERLEDFCALKPLFTSGSFDYILIEDNLVNPSQEDVINNCE